MIPASPTTHDLGQRVPVDIDDHVTAVTFRPDEPKDPDLDLVVRQELEDLAERAWWFEETHPEQIAWETLMADAHTSTVAQADAQFGAMLDALAKGERDDVPF